MTADDMFQFLYLGASSALQDGRVSAIDVFRAILDSAGLLAPDDIHVGDERHPFTLQAVEQILRRGGNDVTVTLGRDTDPQALYYVSLRSGKDTPGLRISLQVPWSYFSSGVEEKSSQFTDFVRAIAAVWPALYGWAHSLADATLGTDPVLADSSATIKVYEAYWLNIYGERLVRRLGRRVLSTPGVAVESLPHGAIMLLTAPTPLDYASASSRSIQAEVLGYLQREDPNTVLGRLMERSTKLAPVEEHWDPDVAEVLERLMTTVPYEERGRRTSEYNEYRPPPVSEVRPMREALRPNVENTRDTVRWYAQLADNLITFLDGKVPGVVHTGRKVLPDIDYYFWRHRYPKRSEMASIQSELVPAIGAYLGLALIRELGGHWIPRENIEESQVVVGDKVWLPFLRARHYMQSRQSILDHSLTQFFHAAQRAAGESESEGEDDGQSDEAI